MFVSRKFLLVCVCLLWFVLPESVVFAQMTSFPVTGVGRCYIMPSYVEHVEQPFFSLNGKWKFRYSNSGHWSDIQVPGEAAMQGFAIEHDKTYSYKRSVIVPSDYAGKCSVLRVDGVYSYARLFVNGTYVCEHHGGFTRWEVDVTSLVRVGRKNEIRLDVVDRLDDISYASGYAHHPIGGILRDVTLFALPQSHLYDVSIETHLDSLYRDADLYFSCSYSGGGDAEVELVLTAPDGKRVSLQQSRFPLRGSQAHYRFTLPVLNPLKWDAEHPHLYTLNAVVRQQGQEINHFVKQIGFRDVRIVKDKMLVNGRPVKLRGACRHDIHPVLGRTTTAELDSLDAVLFKQSNMNFVRTSHYPPTERFLSYCDKLGIYVECESAVCFVDTYRQKNYAPGNSQNDSTFANRYLGQCQEMVKSFRSHPSILFWSIGNESAYGSNFQLCWDWVKAEDATRPVIFSYPGSSGKQKIYDILSMHYQDVNGDLSQWGMSTRNFQGHGIPALFDEWAHPACYTYETLQYDPNIREFWGKSLDLMWKGLFDAPGGLGGAIWGYIDETFSLPHPKMGTAYWKEFARTAKPEAFQGNCVGYGEWGIVDVWRRTKPEFWSTKKAYSPVRLFVDDELPFTVGQRLLLTVYNRFDHTNLTELSASYTFNGKRKKIKMPSVAPHQKGIIAIPAEKWEAGEPLLIEFFAADGTLVDAYQPILGMQRVVYPEPMRGGKLQVTESDEYITVKGDGFEIPFSKETGLMVGASVKGQELIDKGPLLNAYVNLNHLTGAEVRKMANCYRTTDYPWRKTSLGYVQQVDGILVNLSGIYDQTKVDFQIKITGNGQLFIDYLIDGLPNGYLRESGLTFSLSDAIHELAWKRKGYWNYYSEESLSGNEGRTLLYASKQASYGQKPVQPWADDTHNYYYWADAGTNSERPLTQRAKGMKENIYYYSLFTVGEAEKHSLSVIAPDASVACRLEKLTDGKLLLHVNNRWDYPEIAWGNFCKKIEALPCYGSITLYLK